MSEQGEARDRLIKCVEPLRAWREAFLDSYVVLDRAGVVMMFNSAFFALLPRRISRNLEGRVLQDFLSFKHHGKRFNPVREYLEKATPTRLEDVEGRGPEETFRNLTMTITPIREKEEVLGALVVLRIEDHHASPPSYEESEASLELQSNLQACQKALWEAQQNLKEAREQVRRYQLGLETPWLGAYAHGGKA